jgi:hypothetical protein
MLLYNQLFVLQSVDPTFWFLSYSLFYSSIYIYMKIFNFILKNLIKTKNILAEKKKLIKNIQIRRREKKKNCLIASVRYKN